VAAKPPLLRVCELLNEAGAKYLICGAQACILHGLVRTTEDVDILVEATVENCQRVINGLARMQDGAARELTPTDILENVVVKVAEAPAVDPASGHTSQPQPPTGERVAQAGQACGKALALCRNR
jgi:hypothetical protein